MIRNVAILFGAGALALGLSTPAKAELSFCNETDINVSIAIGYLGGDKWTSEGWWNAAAGDCVTVVDAPAPQSYYYWHAVNANGEFVSEDYYFCAVDDVFTIIGDTDCEARGHNRLSFNEIQIDANGSSQVRLTAALAPAPPAQPQVQKKTAEPAQTAETQPQKSQETAALAVAEPAEPEPEPQPTPAAVTAAQPTLSLASDIPVSELLSSAPVDFPAIKLALMGDWSQNGSDGATSTIMRDRFEDFKNGVASGKGSWRLVASCPNALGEGPGVVVLYDANPDMTLCMVLQELSETAFTVLNPVGGQLVTYSR